MGERELMFSVGLEWWRGLAQVAVYSAVVLVILWILSKIKTNEREGE
jgi:hypothetical protein